MTKKIILNDINNLLEMIRDQVQIIQSYEGKIPQIELDIIMSNIRRLYDDFYDLNVQNRQLKAEVADPSTKDTFADEPQRELVTIISKVILEEPEIKEIKEEKVVEKIEIHEVITKEEIPSVEPPKEEIKAPDVIKPAEKTKVPTDLFAETENVTLADKFRDDKKTFHDKITSHSSDKTIADTLQKPLADLRTGIGVNDRFVFINELFSGSMSDYQAAIEALNKQNDLNNALVLLNQYMHDLRWKENSDALIKLKGFLQRRFR